MTEEYKYKYWMVTVLEDARKGSTPLPCQDLLENIFNELGVKWVFQKEEHPNSLGKYHYQCCLATKIRTRKTTLLKTLSASLEHPVERLRVDRMAGTWEQAVLYCTKEDTACDAPRKSLASRTDYTGSDIAILDDDDSRYPWQKSLLDEIFIKAPRDLKTPDDRTIIWITDEQGCSGKSKLTKYLCVHNDNIAKISFGSANQLRSAVISAGAKELYIIDMPRTLADDDSLASVISVSEDIRNGFVVSAFYGTSTKLVMNPPHIVIFSNKRPKTNILSMDRWKIYTIIDLELKYAFENHDYAALNYSYVDEGEKRAID